MRLLDPESGRYERDHERRDLDDPTFSGGVDITGAPPVRRIQQEPQSPMHTKQRRKASPLTQAEVDTWWAKVSK